MARPRKLPSVFAYEDYRPYLGDYYRARKALDPAFSYGAFAKHAGIASRSHLKLVTDGRKALTPAFVERYAKALHLDPDETRYLRLLMERAQGRDGAGGALHELRYARQHAVAPEAAQAIIRSWPLRLVFALTRVAGFRADPGWIRRKLGGRIRRGEARKALDFLRGHGLIVVRGDRLLRSDSGRVPLKASHSGRDAERIHRRVQEEILGPDRGKSWGTISLSAMTPEEAEEVHRRFRQAVLSQPGRGVTRPGTELYLVQTAVKPLTVRESVSSGVNTRSQRDRASRRRAKG